MRPAARAEQFLPLTPALLLIVGAGQAMSSVRSGATREFRDYLIVAAAALTLLLLPLALCAIAPGCDLILASATSVLQAIGAVTLLVVASYTGPESDFYWSVSTRQLLYVVGSSLAVVLGTAAARHIDRVTTYPYTLLAAALGLTVITMLVGRTVNGARLWLAVGPVTFQPSELSRLLLVGFVAVYLHDKRYLVATPWKVLGFNLPPAPYLLPLAVATSASIAVLMLQNDLGMAALVALGALVTIGMAVRSKSLTTLGAIICGLAGAFAAAMVQRVRDRVSVWLDPWGDPAGVGFQFVQSEYALAAGGIGGREPSTSALRIPELHTDFMFAAIGGELGWLVAVATLVLAAILVCRCVLASFRAQTPFRALLALAFASLLAIQILLIIGGTLRILPLTGLTLPLVSYGGTSMIVTAFAIGVTIGISAPGAPVAATRPFSLRRHASFLRQPDHRSEGRPQ